MAIVNNAHTSVEGVVEAVNDKGLKIDGDWVNLSRFRPLDLPEQGARVRAEVDPRGYLCGIDVLDSGKSPAVSRSPRDETITRLAVLKAAANFLGLMGQSREEVKSDHVLILAERWLEWVNHD